MAVLSLPEKEKYKPTLKIICSFPEIWYYKAHVTHKVSWLKCKPDAQVSERVNKCLWRVLNAWIVSHDTKSHSFIFSPTQKSFRWWKKELIRLIFQNYCSRKLMPHDTMPHFRVGISERPSVMTARLFPFFIGLFLPKL